MLDKIKPGARVNVKVAKAPTNEAARKTLVRVLSKSDQVKARNAHLRKVRDAKYNPSMRGGRLYGGRMIKLPAIKPDRGVEQTLTATVDVLVDLKSVGRFVEVTPA